MLEKREYNTVEYSVDISKHFADGDFNIWVEWIKGSNYIAIRQDLEKSVAVHVCLVDDLIEALTELRTKYRSEQL